MQHEHHQHNGQEQKKGLLRQYLPLILVLGTILLLITAWQYFTTGFNGLEFMRLFMALFFLSFGSFKLLDWKGFVDAYQGYDVIAKRSRAYGFVYPLIELSLGVLYIGNWYPFWTNVFTVVLMAVSSIGVIQAVTSHRKIRCACLGTVVQLPMTTVTIIEDLGMGLMALAMLFFM